MKNEKVRIVFWLLIFFGVLVWSGINPHDRYTWALEVTPAVLGLVVLAFTYRQFRFSILVYWLILIHAIILMIGGRYTYAMVPLFNWIKDSFELSRNHYDKVGHFAQGFIPALIIREILIRKSPLRGSKWLFFVVVSICLALSALYELVEWWVAIASGTAAEAFLGTQGYVWDTQSDMALALVGAILSLLFLGRYHDRAIEHVVKLDLVRQNDSTRTTG